MYIQNIHILYYVGIGLIGLLVGQFVDWCNKRLPEYKKIFSKEFFSSYLKNVKPKYLLAFVTAILYVLILYFVGWKNNISYQIRILEYMVLAPMLLSAFCIDWKLQIIPNRLNLTIFEVGLIFMVIQSLFSVNIAMDRVLGGLLGAGIFLIITLIGGLIAGKEAMGFGDVKFMGALGLFFGWRSIIVISLIAFLIAAIISIILLVTKKKKSNEYIPFGPFIVIATFITMIVPADIIIFVLFKIFTLGMG